MKAVGSNGALSSGELADLTGVSRGTLRDYERKDVLPRPLRGHNGYRRYSSEALQRVRLVRRALSVGFTLAELARVLKVRDAGGAPCEESEESRLKNYLRFKNYANSPNYGTIFKKH